MKWDYKLKLCQWITNYRHIWSVSSIEPSGLDSTMWFSHGKCKLCRRMLFGVKRVPQDSGRPPYWDIKWKWISYCGDEPFFTHNHVYWAGRESSL